MKILIILGVISAACGATTQEGKEGKSLEGHQFTALHRGVPAVLSNSVVPVAVGHSVSVIPGATTYHAGYQSAVGAAVSPAVSNPVVTFGANHPDLTRFLHHAVQPSIYRQALPAVNTFQYAAPEITAQQTVQVAQHVTPIEFRAVPVAPKQVQVPITRTHVEIPIHQRVHYGVQQYVAGHQTQVHKPTLSAPAIAPPAIFKHKVTHNAPEVTVQHQDYPVIKSVPQFVEQTYHAGAIVEYTAPEIREVGVPTPYKVPVPQPISVVQPVQVSAQYAVESIPNPVVVSQHAVQAEFPTAEILATGHHQYGNIQQAAVPVQIQQYAANHPFQPQHVVGTQYVPHVAELSSAGHQQYHQYGNIQQAAAVPFQIQQYAANHPFQPQHVVGTQYVPHVAELLAAGHQQYHQYGNIQQAAAVPFQIQQYAANYPFQTQHVAGTQYVPHAFPVAPSSITGVEQHISEINSS